MNQRGPIILAWEKSKQSRGSAEVKLMISETRRASVLWGRQCLYDRRITFCFPLVQRSSRPDRGADMGWIPGSTSPLYLLICKWANIRSLWCWLCCLHILTFQWNTDNHVIGRWQCTQLTWFSGSWALICVALVLFGLRKLIYTLPDKPSRLNYRRKPLCWQRWNPGRGNICLEILGKWISLPAWIVMTFFSHPFR